MGEPDHTACCSSSIIPLDFRTKRLISFPHLLHMLQPTRKISVPAVSQEKPCQGNSDLHEAKSHSNKSLTSRSSCDRVTPFFLEHLPPPASLIPTLFPGPWDPFHQNCTVGALGQAQPLLSQVSSPRPRAWPPSHRHAPMFSAGANKHQLVQPGQPTCPPG